MFLTDLRLTLRRWRRQPLTALLVVAPLALAIGTATALMTLMASVYADPGQSNGKGSLVSVYLTRLDKQTDPRWQETWNRQPFSRVAWKALDEASPFAAFGVAVSRNAVALESPVKRQVDTLTASSGVFEAIGTEPALGRLFDRSEDATESPSVLISYALWEGLFGQDVGVIGREIRAVSQRGGPTVTHQIVGVLPQTFRIRTYSPDLVFPIGVLSPTSAVSGIARLRLGQSIEAAAAQAGPILSQSTQGRSVGINVVEWTDELPDGQVLPFTMLLAAAGLLVLISAVNVASVLAAQAKRRQGETLVRLALGASMWRLFSERVTELILFVVVTAVTGLLVALWAIPLAGGLLPALALESSASALSGRVFLLALAVGVGAAGVVAVAATFGQTDRYGGKRLHAQNGMTRRGLRYYTCSAVVAVTCLLMVCAFLFVQVLQSRVASPVGFQPEGLVVAELLFSDKGASPSANWTALSQQLLSIEGLPGIETASAVSGAPFHGEGGIGVGVRIPGQGDADLRAHQMTVLGPYFRSSQIELLSGTLPAGTMDPSEAVVSRSFARKYLDDAAIGRTFEANGRERVAIAVVADVPMFDVHEDPRPVFYASEPTFEPTVHLVVRASRGTESLPTDLRKFLQTGGDRVAVRRVGTMESTIARVQQTDRVRALLATLYALVALSLAAVGIGALVGNAVNERRREFALRIVLGARHADLYQSLLKSTGLTVAAGIAAGVVLAVGAGVYLRSIVAELPVSTVSSYVWPCAVVGLVGLVSSFLAARSIDELSPVDALRD